MRSLLDVNVLVALHDSRHAHHLVAATWFQAHLEQGWASCPITQNGCLRVLSQPGYTQPLSVADALAKLQRSVATPSHAFWPDAISLLDAANVQHAQVHGPRQLTDIYLLALAVHHGGRLVTLDQRIPLTAVHGATPDHLVVL